MDNDCTNIEELISNILVSKLLGCGIKQFKGFSSDIDQNSDDKNLQLLQTCFESIWNFLVFSHTVQVVLVVPEFKNRTNQTGRQEKYVSHIC